MALWNLYQEMEIRQSRADQRASDEAHTSRIARTDRGVERLEDRFEKLLILNEAMWELLSEHLGFTDAHLVHKVREIDERDGTVNGRRAVVIRRCSKCDAAIGRGQSRCLFCGHDEPSLEPFDGV